MCGPAQALIIQTGAKKPRQESGSSQSIYGQSIKKNIFLPVPRIKPQSFSLSF